MSETQNIAFISGWGLNTSVFETLKNQLGQSFQYYELALPIQDGVECTELDDTLAYLEKQMPSHCHLVAWSLGGMFAVRLAERLPNRVDSLVTLATNTCFTVREDWQTAMEPATFERFRADFLSDWQKASQRFVGLQVLGLKERRSILSSLRNHSYLNHENQSPAFDALNWLVELDNRWALSRLTLPQCHIFGNEDTLVPNGAAQAISRLISDDVVSEFHCLEQAGHLPHIACPDKVASIIQGFAERLSHSVPSRDRRQLERSFSKAAESYDRHAGLQREVASDLVACSGGIAGRVLDLGCGTGFVAESLAHSAETRSYTGLDISLAMIDVASAKDSKEYERQWCCADMESLPFADNGFDCISSSLAIQWLENLEPLFSEVHRVLKTNGKFVLATLGPSTLKELRSAWAEAAPEHVHVNDFMSVEALVQESELNGFELELCRVDHRVIDYQNVFELMRDLKGIGARNLNRGRNTGMTGKGRMRTLQSAYEPFRSESGALPATYEVIYLVLKAEQEHK